MFAWFKRRQLKKDLIEALRGYLGPIGVEHFTQIYMKHGRLCAVEQHGIYPHAVHFREGMKVRNFLRSTGLCEGWTAHDYDNQWEDLTLRACGLK